MRSLFGPLKWVEGRLARIAFGTTGPQRNWYRAEHIYGARLRPLATETLPATWQRFLPPESRLDSAAAISPGPSLVHIPQSNRPSSRCRREALANRRAVGWSN